MSHLRTCGGNQLHLWIQLQIYICVVPFEVPLHLHLPVPCMFHIRLCGGNQLHLWLQLQIHICVVYFEGPLHLHLQSHLCFTLDYLGRGINSISGSSSRSIFCVVPFEDPLHPWLQYHLCFILDHEGGQLHLWLQINICVVHFEGPLHHQLQFNVHFALDYVEGINSMSGSNSRIIFVLHLWGSTPSLPPVLSMSHLRS